MLGENVVAALLQTSVAGAGIILAVYTLIIPISHRIFEERKRKFTEALNEFRRKAPNLGEGSSTQDIDYLSTLMDKIRGSKKLPKYISIGTFVVFSGYLASALLSLLWLTDAGRSVADSWLPAVFSSTTIGFLFVGLISIKDTYSSLKKDYDETLASLKKPNGIPQA